MRWRDGRRSSNIEDRRGSNSVSPLGGGNLGGVGGAAMLFRFLPFLLKNKIGRGILIFGVVVFFGAKFMGIDLMPLLSGGAIATGGNTATQPSATKLTPEEQQLGDFVSVVLADTESTWHTIFQQMGKQYKEPKLVLFSRTVSSACGMAQSAMGPFYCPADQKVYIDLSFYRDLKNRHNAPGDFAQAYVIAHEVGHHVQTLLGISSQVHQAKQRVSKAEGNALSVKQELQADCFAGLWGYSANIDRQLLEQDDLQEALVAASAIGDDRLQHQAQGYVVPESFTHGSSEQRVRWFTKGFKTGDISQCDTFSAAQL